MLSAGVLATADKVYAKGEERMARVGFLANANPENFKAQLNEFHARLRENGYIEGKNIVIEYRWAAGNFSSHPDIAAELVRTGTDVIVTWGSPATAAAKKATSTIPIVMVAVGDPVRAGFVASLAKPGANITGVSNSVVEIASKMTELLIQTIPGIKNVAVVRNPVDVGLAPRAAEDASHVGIAPDWR